MGRIRVVKYRYF